MLKQISRAKLRTLKEDLVPGVPLIFSKEEVLQLRDEMLLFVTVLVAKLEQVHGT